VSGWLRQKVREKLKAEMWAEISVLVSHTPMMPQKKPLTCSLLCLSSVADKVSGMILDVQRWIRGHRRGVLAQRTSSAGKTRIGFEVKVANHVVSKCEK